MTECATCGAAVDAAVLCGGCTHILKVRLGEVVPLLRELETTVHRLDRAGTGGKGQKNAAPPLPLNIDAMSQGVRLRQCLARWCAAVVEVRGGRVPVPDDFAAYLFAELGWIRTRDFAPDMFADVITSVDAVVRAVDLPPDRKNAVYVGPCGQQVDGGGQCPHELWAAKGHVTVRCRNCGTDWNIPGRRSAALYAAVDELATADAISRALTTHDFDVTAARIYQWRFRGKLVVAAYTRVDNGDKYGSRVGLPLYRVGDVLDLVLGAL